METSRHRLRHLSSRSTSNISSGHAQSPLPLALFFSHFLSLSMCARVCSRYLWLSGSAPEIPRAKETRAHIQREREGARQRHREQKKARKIPRAKESARDTASKSSRYLFCSRYLSHALPRLPLSLFVCMCALPCGLAECCTKSRGWGGFVTLCGSEGWGGRGAPQGY